MPRASRRASSGGRAEERALLGRLAELKFGAPTAKRLSGLLGGLTAPEELLEVGGWIIECGPGAELLDRVGRRLRRALRGAATANARDGGTAVADDNHIKVFTKEGEKWKERLS